MKETTQMRVDFWLKFHCTRNVYIVTGSWCGRRKQSSCRRLNLFWLNLWPRKEKTLCKWCTAAATSAYSARAAGLALRLGALRPLRVGTPRARGRARPCRRAGLLCTGDNVGGCACLAEGPRSLGALWSYLFHGKRRVSTDNTRCKTTHYLWPFWFCGRLDFFFLCSCWHHHIFI